MFKKKSLILSLAFLLVLTLSVNAGAFWIFGDDDGQEKEKLTVGFAVSTQNNPFFVDMKKGAEKRAEEMGVELMVADAQNDAAKQLNSIQDLLVKQIDVLVINPVNGDAIAPAVKSANDQGVPVITVDRSASDGKVVTHIASDNVKGGEMAAEYMAKQLGEEGKVVELAGIPGTSAARDRGEGFNNGIEQYDEISVIARQPAGFDRAKGMTVMENILQAHQEIDAVFAHNDSMALGAVEALKSAGRLDSTLVVGFDAIDDALTAIKDGEMNATIAQQPSLMGEMAIEKAQTIANDKDLKDYYPAKLKLITKDNVQ
ncbi:ribose ABC transporter substrate-binding protein RbsB [Halanaerobacter jeridensis]|uniref:Ribose transport system substrate-binding protein n=1 Tax=Halanaerobacter jeridensis TaxID=706427 RepID=A0A939BMI2_9FIRM|nr:ribose ABC transporter substrate-binding protein RbsB [Halanaerobacter jeridensis]MBM7556565.1 ribose transport system substrate-binding protein [Halanaerobacter jeridensis]